MSFNAEEIRKCFRDPKTGYKGLYVFYKELKEIYPNITYNDVKEILSLDSVYQLNKGLPRKCDFPIFSRTNP